MNPLSLQIAQQSPASMRYMNYVALAHIPHLMAFLDEIEIIVWIVPNRCFPLLPACFQQNVPVIYCLSKRFLTLRIKRD